MKKRLSFAVVLILLFSLIIVPGFSSQDIRVTVDGRNVEFDVPPTVIEGRTLVPLRGIFEALGVTPVWHASTRTVTAQRGSRNIELPLDSHQAKINGQTIEVDVPGTLIGGRTMVPARFIAESLEANVGWDAANRIVLITSGVEEEEEEEVPVQLQDLEVHFVDVGQGDAILVISPNGSVMLVDGGPRTAGEKIVSYLKAAGITSIDKLVATHPHEDHIGGLLSVLDEFEVKKVMIVDSHTLLKHTIVI